ncbi:MAG: hypothetical protein J0G95_14985 [Rhizobiales bacterium]|nr:hypothetical protein [Hyphomicrobiales bacterium]
MTMFQGTSFNPQTLALMRRVLEEAVETLPYPVPSGCVQALARNIIDLAAQGERDPQLMKLLALLALRSRSTG